MLDLASYVRMMYLRISLIKCMRIPSYSQISSRIRVYIEPLLPNDYVGSQPAVPTLPLINSGEINTLATQAIVQFETKVNSKNEAMIKTLHPSLRDFAIVYIVGPDNGQEIMLAVHL